MAEKKSFVLYVDRIKELDMLSDEQLGKLFRAIYHYVGTGTEPNFDELALRIMFSVFQSQINANAAKYAETCKKRSENIKKRWEKQKNTKNTNEYNCIQTSTNNTDTVTDTVTDTENSNDIYKYKSGDTSPEPPVGGVASKQSGNAKSLLGIVKTYTQNAELQNALMDFVRMRTKIKKPLTERALKTSLKKLDHLATTDDGKIAVVDQSTEHCWQTFYEYKQNDSLKENQPKQPMDDFTALFYRRKDDTAC